MGYAEGLVATESRTMLQVAMIVGARSSAVEHSPYTRMAPGSNPGVRKDIMDKHRLRSIERTDRS